MGKNLQIPATLMYQNWKKKSEKPVRTISVGYNTSTSSYVTPSYVTSGYLTTNPNPVFGSTITTTTATGSTWYQPSFTPLADEDKIKLAQTRRLKLEDPFKESDRLFELGKNKSSVFESEYVCYDDNKRPSGYIKFTNGKHLPVEMTEFTKGPKINNLGYIDNNIFATFVFLLGLFEVESATNVIISKVLDKNVQKTYGIAIK